MQQCTQSIDDGSKLFVVNLSNFKAINVKRFNYNKVGPSSITFKCGAILCLSNSFKYPRELKQNILKKSSSSSESYANWFIAPIKSKILPILTAIDRVNLEVQNALKNM